MNSKFGKIIYAAPLAIFGLFHFMNAEAMAAMVPSFLPAGIVFVYLTGAALLAAAVAIILNKKQRLATMLLGVMLLIFALSVWLPMVIGGDQTAMSNVLKDLSLAGAAFFISGNSNS